MGAALQRFGAEQPSPSCVDASSGGTPKQPNAKRPRNVSLEKVPVNVCHSGNATAP